MDDPAQIWKTPGDQLRYIWGLGSSKEVVQRSGAREILHIIPATGGVCPWVSVAAWSTSSQVRHFVKYETTSSCETLDPAQSSDLGWVPARANQSGQNSSRDHHHPQRPRSFPSLEGAPGSPWCLPARNKRHGTLSQLTGQKAKPALTRASVPGHARRVPAWRSPPRPSSGTDACDGERGLPLTFEQTSAQPDGDRSKSGNKAWETRLPLTSL